MASQLVVGRVVHYKDFDQSRTPLCTAAIVSRVVSREEVDDEKGVVHLTVFYSTGPQQKTNVSYGKSEEVGTWHWPVRNDR